MYVADETVFQPELDILGMIIYASEFVLWCGVIACGVYFNFAPWARQKLRIKSQQVRRSEDPARGQTNTEGGISDVITLQELPSSTSVFLTPSSVASLRTSVVSQEQVDG